MRPLHAVLLSLLIWLSGSHALAGSITVNLVSSTVNDLGTVKDITGSMTMGLSSGAASGLVSVEPQAVCFPWAAGKAIVWVLKTAKPAMGASLLDLSGGDLQGFLTMSDGLGTDIAVTFRLTRTGADTADLTAEITATYDPTIAVTGDWTSKELIVGTGPGGASATGVSTFFRESDGSPIAAPYSVNYTFLGDPSAELTRPLLLHQSVSANLQTGEFTALVTVIPEPASCWLMAAGILALLGSRHAPAQRRQGQAHPA